ncbi:S41 family peptidase [Aquimarina aggregata]|uniref:S41 family peptidase n=1 Tax=Aquimarina aggregata TaxID=1642818 RepID=UPI0024939EE0|nr:S41 family peptidase [Aquimarina aggregata]
MKLNMIAKVKNIKSVFIFFLCSVFFSCHSDDDQSPPEDPMNGFWLIADKGYIVEITDDKDVVYSVSNAGCVVLNSGFKIEDSGITLSVVNDNELVGITDQSLSNFKLTRLVNLDERCLPEQLSKTKDPKINFDFFWNIFNDYYAFFELRNVDWSAYENLRDQVTEDNLYTILEELVLKLEDGHVGISDDEKDIDINSGTSILLERLNANLSGDLIIESEDDFDNIMIQKGRIIIQNYLGGSYESDDTETIIWQIINDEIAYVNIFGMAGYGTTINNELTTLNMVLDKMMNDIKMSGVTKLILDIRFNEGGFDKVSSDIASRFTDQQRVVFSKKARLGDGFTEDLNVSLGPKGAFQFTDDIVLLTSPLTASAAEIFTLYLKDLPNVTIVGENTNGVFSDVLEHVLPNGAQIGLSNEIYSDAQGEVYEAIGVGPSTANQVPFLSNDDFLNNKDGGIDKAIEVLNK